MFVYVSSGPNVICGHTDNVCKSSEQVTTKSGVSSDMYGAGGQSLR